MSIPGYRQQCPRCTLWFVICLACDRWHWYCSPECKAQARRASRRKSSDKYRRTGRGRRSNRQAQARHRVNRSKKKSVSHHSSAPPAPLPILGEQPDGRADTQFHGRKEFANDYSPEVEMGLPVEIAAEPRDQVVRAEVQVAAGRAVAGLGTSQPRASKLAYPNATCRVCRRVVSHLVTFDGLGKMPRQRGPPCRRMI